MDATSSLLGELKASAASVRLSILEELKRHKAAGKGQDASRLDRRVRALTNFLKSLRDIEDDVARQIVLSQKETEQQYTPYDQLPPPSPEEMQLIRQRLIDYFDRRDAAQRSNGKYSGRESG